MVFSSEKKELWRYASRNNANCSVGAGNNLPQQLHRHQPLHRLQSPPPDYYATTTTKTKTIIPTSTATVITSRFTDDDNRLNQMQQQQQQQLEEDEEHNLPPPPYSSVPCGIDCSDACQQRRMSSGSNNVYGGYDCGIGGENSMEFGGSVDRYSIGGMSYIDGKSALTCASASSRSVSSFSNSSSSNNNNNNTNYHNNMERNEQHDCYYNNNNHKYKNIYNDNEENVIVGYDQLNSQTIIPPSSSSSSLSTRTTTRTTPNVTSTASVLAATAASIFRNCCGGGGIEGSVEGLGVIGNATTTTTVACKKNNNISSKINKQSILLAKNCNTTTIQYPLRQYFEAFIKHLKESQVTVLLKAVKSRLDPISTLNALHQQQQHHRQQQQQQHATHCCILVHRTLILNEEPNVIACRLFFWNDLKDGNELKRLPDCPNECDPIYICCNPLHWCRIFKQETAPPPYQLRSNTTNRMQFDDTNNFLERNLQNGTSLNVPTRQLNLLANQQNIMKNVGLCVQFPESVASAGEGK